MILARCGPFCYRSMAHTDLTNPVSERWFIAHWLPTQVMAEDAMARNRALQAFIRAQKTAASPKASRRSRGR